MTGLMYWQIPRPLVAPIRSWAADITVARKPNERITRGGDYIHRWFLARKADVPEFGGPAFEGLGLPAPRIMSEVENLYLHRYIRPDREHLHDHPWDNVTLVLQGYLVEQIPGGERLLQPGDVLFRRAEDLHAIRDVEPGTLTLFGTLRKRREWGFVGEEGWVGWRDYRPMFRDAQQVPA